jgi:hypothetical protein
MGGGISAAQNQFFIYQRKKELSKFRKLENKLSVVTEMLVDRRTLHQEQLKVDIPIFKKRVGKLRKVLMKSVASAEINLAQASETESYLLDLRSRLIIGREKSINQPYGANPSDAVLDGVRALEDGNPYSPEYREMESAVQRTIEGHKHAEVEWSNAKIKICSEWIKRLKGIIRKLEANLEIGNDTAKRLDEIASSLEGTARASASQLRQLENEIIRTERCSMNLKEDRLQRDVAAAFVGRLPRLREGDRQAFNSESSARKRWGIAIDRVIHENKNLSAVAERVQLQCLGDSHSMVAKDMSILRAMEGVDISGGDSNERERVLSAR